MSIGRRDSVSIPPRLGDMIGLKPGCQTRLWLTEVQLPYGTRPVVIVAAISPPGEDWGNVYDLDFALRDEAGALATLTCLLAKCGVNILYSWSWSSLSSFEANWHAVVDLGTCGSEGPDRVGWINELIRVEASTNERVKRHILLMGSGKYVKGQKVDTWWKGHLAKSANCAEWLQPVNVTVDARNRLCLPSVVLRRIEECFFGRIPKVVMIAVDSESKILTLSFPRPDRVIFAGDFIVKDQPGSLYLLTDFMARQGVNLLRADSDIQVPNEKAAVTILGEIHNTAYRPFCRSLKEETKRAASQTRLQCNTLPLIRSQVSQIWPRPVFSHLSPTRYDRWTILWLIVILILLLSILWGMVAPTGSSQLADISNRFQLFASVASVLALLAFVIVEANKQRD